MTEAGNRTVAVDVTVRDDNPDTFIDVRVCIGGYVYILQGDSTIVMHPDHARAVLSVLSEHLKEGR